MNTTVKFGTKETHYYVPDFEWHPIPPAQVPQPIPDLFPTHLPAAGPRVITSIMFSDVLTAGISLTA